MAVAVEVAVEVAVTPKERSFFSVLSGVVGETLFIVCFPCVFSEILLEEGPGCAVRGA